MKNMVRIKGRTDNKWFIIGAALLIIACLFDVRGNFSFIKQMIENHFPLWRTIMLATGFWQLAAAVLLLISAFKRIPLWIPFLILTVFSAGFSRYVFLLVLIAAIGFPWNRTPAFVKGKTRAPLLCLVAAVIFVVLALIALRSDISLIGAARIAKAILGDLCWYAGAIILVLFTEPVEVQLKGGQSEAFNKGNTIAHSFMAFLFDNVPGKIQKLARVCAAISLVFAALSAVAFVVFLLLAVTGNDTYLLIALCCLGGVVVFFLSIIPNWFVFAYGQMAEDMRHLREGVPANSGATGTVVDDSDELPEL